MSNQYDHGDETGLHHKLRRFGASLKDVGLIYTLQATSKNIFPRWFLRWGSFAVVGIDARGWSGAQWSEEAIRWVRSEDAAALAATRALPKPLERYLEQGSRMCVAEAAGEIVGYYLYDTGSVEHLDWLLFDLADDVLWNSDTWVAPSQRGQGVHGCMRSFNLSRLTGEGYQRTLSVVEIQNRPSLRAGLKQADVAGFFTYFRLLRFTFLWMDGRLQLGYWHPGHRLTIHSDQLHSVPGQKFGRHRAAKLERHVHGRGGE